MPKPWKLLIMTPSKAVCFCEKVPNRRKVVLTGALILVRSSRRKGEDAWTYENEVGS